MKKVSVALLTLFFTFFMTATASATLIGDTVSLKHVHSGNDGNDPYFLGEIVVTEGTDDIVSFYKTYTVNMEANQILIKTRSISTRSTWDAPYIDGGMNGLVVSNINDSTGGVLIGFTVDTNYSNWSNDRVAFDNYSIWFDWQSLEWGENVGYESAYFNVTLEFGDNFIAPVPEPGTLLLLGSGLAGLALYRRRMNKA